MENRLQDLRDESRDAECAKRTYEGIQYAGIDTSKLVADCDAIVAKNAREIDEILRALSLDDENRAQLALIAEYAAQRKKPPEAVALAWIERYSGRFRQLWDDGIRDPKSISTYLYRF